MGIRATVANHPALVAVAALVVATVAAFAFVYFEPHKLFIDDTVAEPLPSVGSGETAGGSEGGRESGGGGKPEIETLSSGEFQSHEHSTTGTARVIRLADGSRFVRFEEFETSNGPDLRVYLSAAPPAGPGDTFDDEYVELGELKGNIGDQNYSIPPDVNLERFGSAVVWCERFSVAFGAAPVG